MASVDIISSTSSSQVMRSYGDPKNPMLVEETIIVETRRELNWLRTEFGFVPPSPQPVFELESEPAELMRRADLRLVNVAEATAATTAPAPAYPDEETQKRLRRNRMSLAA